MDYIIFGIGAGSSLVLVGWLLRDWGPPLRDRKSRSDTVVLTAHQLVDQMRWARFCGSCGTALAIGGAFVLLLTTLAMLVNPTDARGAMIVLAAFGVVSVAMLAWSWLFVRRFGVAGIIRREPASVAAHAPPGEEGRLDEKHDDFGFGPGTEVTQASEPEPVPRRGFHSMMPKNPFASRSVEQATPAPMDAPGQTPGEDQAERTISIHDDQANVIETGDGDEAGPSDEAKTNGDDEEPIDAPETAVEVVSPDEVSVEDEPAIESGQVTNDSVDAISEERPDDAAPESRSDDDTDTAGESEEDGAPEESAGETMETMSGREEALRNLRQRRLGRLTRDPS